MSRIGNKVITIPAGVEVNLDDNFATVKGPKGELKQQFDKDMTFNVEGNEITVVRPSDSKRHRTVHGTTRAVALPRPLCARMRRPASSRSPRPPPDP